MHNRFSQTSPTSNCYIYITMNVVECRGHKSSLFNSIQNLEKKCLYRLELSDRVSHKQD